MALVTGEVEKNEGKIDFRIARSKTNKTHMAAVPLGGEEGEEAITLYKVLKRYWNYSLLEVNILTGRTHQIRVHLKSLGHSVAGDYKYENKGVKADLKIGRIFLHSYKLGFTDLQGEKTRSAGRIASSIV